MKPLYTPEEFSKCKSRDKLPLECQFCSSIFYKSKHSIMDALNPNQSASGDFCSLSCRSKQLIIQRNFSLRINVSCDFCSKNFSKRKFEILKTKHNFCSQSCSATFNNRNKKYGTRRSKLESWIEEEFSSVYPNLNIDFNKKDAIKSELDIYVPSLKLAFELNGIVHYEPIYGLEKLGKIQNNDLDKLQKCLNEGIDLRIINCSKMKRFKPEKARDFLNQIVEIIESYLCK